MYLTNSPLPVLRDVEVRRTVAEFNHRRTTGAQMWAKTAQFAQLSLALNRWLMPRLLGNLTLACWIAWVLRASPRSGVFRDANEIEQEVRPRDGTDKVPRRLPSGPGGPCPRVSLIATALPSSIVTGHITCVSYCEPWNASLAGRAVLCPFEVIYSMQCTSCVGAQSPASPTRYSCQKVSVCHTFRSPGWLPSILRSALHLRICKASH